MEHRRAEPPSTPSSAGPPVPRHAAALVLGAPGVVFKDVGTGPPHAAEQTSGVDL